MIANRSKIITYAAVLIAAILCWKGWNTNRVVIAKYTEQITSNEKLERYVESFKALRPVRDRWNNLYERAGVIKDINSAYKVINVEGVGLYGHPDKMAIHKVERVSSGNVDLGLIKICPSAASSSGFLVGAPTMKQLFLGIEKLSERRDIEISSISISPEKGKTTATLGLCLLVRGDDEARK